MTLRFRESSVCLLMTEMVKTRKEKVAPSAEKKMKILHRPRSVACMGAYPLWDALDRRGSIELAHNVNRSTATQNSPFLPYSGGRNHRQNSLLLPTMGWPGCWPEWQSTRERSPISVLTQLDVNQLGWCAQGYITTESNRHVCCGYKQIVLCGR